MRTLKTPFLYFCDFWRVLLVKIPLNLIKNKKGNVILLFLAGLAILFGGLHFWTRHQVESFAVQSEVERMLQDNNLGQQISFIGNGIDYRETGLCLSSREFVEELKPGETVFVSYVFEEIKRLGQGENGKLYLLKVYRAGENGQEIICRTTGDMVPDYRFSKIISYTQDSLTLEKNESDTAVFAIWLPGGLIWFLALFVICLMWDDR